VKPGKGSAFVRSKLKNLLNGSNKDQTFRAGEMLNVADINRREGQFTYAEGDTVSDSWGGGGGEGL
jgi:translation elongation factor P/translation initiation factor 5A